LREKEQVKLILVGERAGSDVSYHCAISGVTLAISLVAVKPDAHGMRFLNACV